MSDYDIYIAHYLKSLYGMLPWFNDAMYLYQLEQVDEYQSLSTTVR